MAHYTVTIRLDDDQDGELLVSSIRDMWQILTGDGVRGEIAVEINDFFDGRRPVDV
jgi:hypothetical protein